MLYPVITQASDARESWGKECSRAGKATFTIERSREAMKAPRAVTAKTRFRRRAVLGAPVTSAVTARGSATGLNPVATVGIAATLGDCILLCNPLTRHREAFADKPCSIAPCLDVVGAPCLDVVGE